MATTIAAFSMSLDGYVARPDGSVGPLFDWYENGHVETRWPGMGMTSHTTAASAAHLARLISGAGAIVTGRRLFDYTKGWGGDHPLHVPVFVLTHGDVPRDWVEAHPDAPFTFVTDGLESALAQAAAVAGDRLVGIAGPNVAQQALNAGLLDEVHIDLVPVLLGEGIPFFDQLRTSPVLLDDPIVAHGERVTHLTYRVRRER